MATLDSLEFKNDFSTYSPRGRYSLVEAVDLVSRAIALCRDRRVHKLLVNATGLIDLPIPSLVDRFLMVEDWAREANGTVIVAMVVHPQYIHPRKFGVTVALKFGLVCDVHASEKEASAWLLATAAQIAKTKD